MVEDGYVGVYGFDGGFAAGIRLVRKIRYPKRYGKASVPLAGMRQEKVGDISVLLTFALSLRGKYYIFSLSIVSAVQQIT